MIFTYAQIVPIPIPIPAAEPGPILLQLLLAGHLQQVLVENKLHLLLKRCQRATCSCYTFGFMSYAKIEVENN